MNRLITLFIAFSIYSYASLIGSNFTQRDLQILEDLDIKSSFITDYKLQEVYEEYQYKRNSEYYVSKLNEASLFVPRVKDILRQEGIPDVFIFMAMAESNFDIDAKSNVKATGLWQFMNSTGLRYGLKNNMYVDERMDLVKSTHAATKYLNYLYSKFDKWYLAAIAYNCGEGRVIEALTRATLDSYIKKNPKEKYNKKIKEYRRTISLYQQKKVRFNELYKIYKEVKSWNIELDIVDLFVVQKVVSRQYIPTESRNYIRKIISLAMMNSVNFIKEDENSHLLNIGISATVATVNVKGGLHLRNIANSIGMTYEDLLGLNKHIKQSIIPPSQKEYTINIPYAKLTKFNEKKDEIQNTKFAIHIVKKGDTLSHISLKYKVPTKLIKEYNNFKSNRLAINQKIILPIPANILDEKIVSLNLKQNSIKNYTVKSGDSLSSIAREYKTDVKRLMKVNKMKDTLLKIGDRLVLK